MPHTPAPWDYNPDNGEVFYDDRPGSNICPCIATVDLSNCAKKQGHADGRLIAAAPVMLTALTEAVPFFQEEIQHLLRSFCHLDDAGNPIRETLTDDDAVYVKRAEAALKICEDAIAAATQKPD